MKIGEHEVTQVTEKSAKVGCQVVTKEEAEQVLKLMNEASNVVIRVGNKDNPSDGDVWLTQDGDGVTLRMRVKGSNWHLIKLTPQGFVRSTYCDGTNIPVEDVGGRSALIKISGYN